MFFWHVIQAEQHQFVLNFIDRHCKYHQEANKVCDPVFDIHFFAIAFNSVPQIFNLLFVKRRTLHDLKFVGFQCIFRKEKILKQKLACYTNDLQKYCKSVYPWLIIEEPCSFKVYSKRNDITFNCNFISLVISLLMFLILPFTH